MSNTTVTLTGTGVPHAAPGRAGAGVLVRYKKIALQFDAGRATVLRLIEAGVSPTNLTALFVTHYHSDHVVDLPDVVLTRWIQENMHKAGPLPIVTPHGSALRFVERMMDAFDDDIHIRKEHTDNVDFRTDITSSHHRAAKRMQQSLNRIFVRVDTRVLSQSVKTSPLSPSANKKAPAPKHRGFS
jgi:ribonuclease BN (tRNA processing enzyme)